ncbi:MAG: F0F1 ATP synthase subunit B [Eubacteriales bacterium]|nr:F0F1 ATP synthase subunit B [Eubacteriales bacterium]
MQRLIGFDAQLLFDAIITGINILFLFCMLTYLLFKPATKLLDGRKEKIKNDLLGAEKSKKEAENLKLEYEQKLKEVRIECDEIREKAKESAKISSQDIIQKANDEAKLIIERAHTETELEKDKARDTLKNEVVNIATIFATKLVKENITLNQKEKLFDETLREIGDDTWQS